MEERWWVCYVCRGWVQTGCRGRDIDSCALRRYGNHALTYRIVDRIFAQVPRKFKCKEPGKMGYEDFCWFIFSEEDKTTDVALSYWFKASEA